MARIESLSLVHRACWDELASTRLHKQHPWRVLALATTGAQGADVRSVVLREVDAGTQTLVFFTDARSAKAAQIAADGRGTVLAWSQPLGWQLRLRVALRIETGGLAVSSRWAQLKMTPAAQDYLSPLPPGAPVERYEPERASRGHFAVLTARVQQMDWLELHPDGHRRALFDSSGQGQWVVP